MSNLLNLKNSLFSFIRIFVYIAFILLVIHNNANAMSEAECSEFASEMNKIFPLRIDKTTTTKNLYCSKNNEVVTLQYIMEVDMKSVAVFGIEISKSDILKTWCKSPELLGLLEWYPVRYEYFLENGKLIGAISFS